MFRKIEYENSRDKHDKNDKIVVIKDSVICL